MSGLDSWWLRIQVSFGKVLGNVSRNKPVIITLAWVGFVSTIQSFVKKWM
jgi:hypothetical protein